VNRFRLWVFNALAILSLLLFAATVALWIRTYWRDDQITIYSRYSTATQPSALIFITASYPYFTRAGFYQSFPIRRNFHQFDQFLRLTIMHRTKGVYVRCLGFAFSSNLESSVAPPCRFVWVGIPLWFPLVVSSITPALWLLKRKTRAKIGKCVICGYDLRATPDRCPECGKIVEKTI
jgi:hypothetical protein